ncbi:universal stress protein [Rhizobium leguminosarum]|uniref:universal stress protein n=1 Tax=Rhizobium leguminosarum TaxID=384 RepID=UPI001030F658|nr:universal stress protein [Rhizobium leguminosarum]TAV81546.1 universal stress protein [Rhizobium leguminosarum]TAV81817.1 universal stress protein [Rhizobium leguminosarum]TAW25985.1 universal stress protein [Rhizobium leguminosarum]TAX23556.1 universal stress protein [Rhizobium leguminosarum]TAY26580.1 universal stress protein [Rhizobium leguminosarum]
MKQHLFLPLLTYPDATSEFMIANAVALAHHMQATLTVCAVEITIPEVSNALSSLIIDAAKMARDAGALSRKHASALTGMAVDAARAASVDVRTREIKTTEPFVVDALAEASRAYDLVLLETAGISRPIVEAVLFASGRPLILYPTAPFGGRMDHVAIAWDGSRAAARAAHDASFFLERASKVCLLSVIDEKPIETGDYLIENLLKSGVMAEATRVRACGEPVGEVLQTKAFELRADLLVMGGFGHSRLREFVLGGATQAVLTNVSLPILLSH